METENDIIITIAIPFHNAEKYLPDAIDSVIWQTFTKFNLLLVDDGSTDSSLQIARSYERKDSRVKVYSDGRNRNLGFRLNQMSGMVSTKYLARMDADDIMHPDKIKKQLTVLEANPEIDVLGTNAYSIDENNSIQGIRLMYGSNKILERVRSFIHPTIVAKTAWFLDNPYDVKAIRVEDAELWFRTVGKYNFQIMTEPLFFYREFGNKYYKKYFKGFAPMLYVLQKYSYNLSLLKFVMKYYLSGAIYFCFYVFNGENYLINNRNAKKISNLTVSEVLKNAK